MLTAKFAGLARWCFAHRAATIGAWVAAIVVVGLLAGAAGKKQSSDFRLPGTESQRAYDQLKAHSPAQNGTSDQIVFHATSGTLRSGANQAAVASTVTALRKTKGVVSVSDPSSQIGRDGTIAVANVLYRFQLDDPDLDAVKAVQKTAFARRSGTLQIENGGQGAEAQRTGSGGGGTALIGFGVAAIVLLLTFGSAIAAGLPLLTAILALAGTYGGITLFSHVVDTPDFASQLADLIGIGVGVDYALFVITRYRTEVAQGHSRHDAAGVALDTAGRAVFFAGTTVIIALLGLLLLGLNFLQGVAVGAALAVLLTMVAALTLLPALLGWSGDWVDRLRLPLPRREKTAGAAAPSTAAAVPGSADTGGWGRWARFIQAHPWPAMLVSLVILLGLAAPALGLRLGNSDAGVDPTNTTTRKAYDLIAQGFGPGVNGTFLTAVAPEGSSDGLKARATQIAAAIRTDHGIASVSAANVSADGKLATLTAIPKSGPQAKATEDTLDRVRDDVIPAAAAKADVQVSLGGTTASQEDFTQAISNKLPLFVGVVVVLSALLLLAVFRSIFIPIKAAIMNLLSIGAALGFVTLVFQNGVGASIIDVQTGPIASFLPVLLFAIVFGLSMDYEVFLVSRVHEEWERSHDASNAVVRGLASTGRVITAAAVIMIFVFASFAFSVDDRVVKLFGVGLASAVLFDAVIIRCLLVPAVMELAGRRAWYLPSWLGKVLPRLSIEGSGPATASRGA